MSMPLCRHRPINKAPVPVLTSKNKLPRVPNLEELIKWLTFFWTSACFVVPDRSSLSIAINKDYLTTTGIIEESFSFSWFFIWRVSTQISFLTKNCFVFSSRCLGKKIMDPVDCVKSWDRLFPVLPATTEHSWEDSTIQTSVSSPSPLYF